MSEPIQEAQSTDQVTFTPEQQALVDKIIADRLERDRKSRDLTPDEVKALKAQAADAQKVAEANKSEAEKAAERLAELESRLAESDLRALRASVQARFGIDPEDAELFLTGSDEQTLTRQAERLAQRTADQSPKRRRIPEGKNPNPPADDRVSFVRQLTAGAN